jgi:molybdopterin/thiamine biosynthesis adenylyltransferase
MRFTPEEVDRYGRHLVLKEIGGQGQQRLKGASVAVVGAGGLGGPAALYLAAAGVGRLRLIDDDDVALSNLQRQILFRTDDVGRSKTEAGRDALLALNPNITVETIKERLDGANAPHLIGDCGVVLDGTDSFEARFAVNAAALRCKTYLVSGALGRWGGQVAGFSGRPCYRCFVPSAPPEAETCARVGVIGALAGVVGALMALDAVKHLTGAGETLEGRLYVIDALSMTSRTIALQADPSCPACGREAAATP